MHEVDYPWVARAIRGWPGSATGPEHSESLFTEAVLEFLEKTDVGKIKKGVIVRGEMVE